MTVAQKPDSSTAATTRLIWSLFGIALILRVAAAVYTGGLAHPETFEYDGMARSLLLGNGLVYRHLNVPYHSFAPPLYPWLSAASYWLFNSLVPLMALKIVAGSYLAVVAARIAQRLYPGRIAMLGAGLLVAIHPGLVLYSIAKAHPLTFDALFFTLAVLLALRLREQLSLRRAVEFGLIVGIGSLCRATLIIILPIVAIWLIVAASSNAKTVRAIAVAGFCAAMIVCPWTI